MVFYSWRFSAWIFCRSLQITVIRSSSKSVACILCTCLHVLLEIHSNETVEYDPFSFLLVLSQTGNRNGVEGSKSYSFLAGLEHILFPVTTNVFVSTHLTLIFNKSV